LSDQNIGDAIEVRATHQEVDVDEIPASPQGGPPAQEKHTLQGHHYDATLSACRSDLSRQPERKLTDEARGSDRSVSGGLGHAFDGIERRWPRIKD
jgi:hypothetical protein